MSATNVERWREQGELTTIGERHVFVRRVPGDGPTLLLLHGFPSSSIDWRRLLDALPGRAALAFDFLGFGLSDKPRRHVYSLLEQADLAEESVCRWVDGPVVVVAHDMGTSVATELMRRDIEGRLRFRLAAVLLLNGSVILDRASLTIGQRMLRSRLGWLFARLSSKPAFRQQLASLFSPAHPLEREELDDQWALWTRAGGHRVAHRLIRYLDERERFAERWHGAVRDWPGPLAIGWGMRDPVATPHVLAGLRDLRPEARVTEWADLGHYPQIEAPELVAGLVRRMAADAR